MSIITKISVMGDSILRGIIFDEISGKYKFLKQSAVNLFGQTNAVTVTNYSSFGCTTIKALKNLDNLLKTENSSQAVLLELGGNDCDYDWQAVLQNPQGVHTPKVPYEQFKQGLCLMAEAILKAGKRPVMMNLPPIDSIKYFNSITKNDEQKGKALLSFLQDKSYIYRHQELYSRAIEAVALKYGLYLVNVRDVFLAVRNYSDYLCMDGIHPNELGQAIIKQVFDRAYYEAVLIPSKS